MGRRYPDPCPGYGLHLEVDCIQEPVREGDLYLLTTDGVHEWLKLSERLAELPATPSARALEKTAHAFVEAALEAGSQDNLSCLMVRVDALAIASEDEIQAELSARVIPPELVEGNKIDHFRVERVIHSGPRSSVYLVRDEKSGERLVLKCPSERYADDLHYLDSFRGNPGWVSVCRIRDWSNLLQYPVEPVFSINCTRMLKGKPFVNGCTTTRNLHSSRCGSLLKALLLPCELCSGKEWCTGISSPKT